MKLAEKAKMKLAERVKTSPEKAVKTSPEKVKASSKKAERPSQEKVRVAPEKVRAGLVEKANQSSKRTKKIDKNLTEQITFSELEELMQQDKACDIKGLTSKERAELKEIGCYIRKIQGKSDGEYAFECILRSDVEVDYICADSEFEFVNICKSLLIWTQYNIKKAVAKAKNSV